MAGTLGKLYLILYNLACIGGWGYCLFLSVTALRDGKSAAELWSGGLEFPLVAVQTAAVMEIVHALIGLVRSPWMTVAIQVSSRLMFVWGYTRYWPECQADWSLFLMTISWSIAEIPRYLYYAVAQIMPSSEIPYPLFWIRYSMFIVLYPSGISGEILQVYAFYRDARAQSDILHYFTYLVALMYVAGGPYMVGNMFSNRKREFKKRKEAAASKSK